MAIIGPISAVSGYLWLSDYPSDISAIMLFAGGHSVFGFSKHRSAGKA
jgi:anaerobic C4-dicarboxylate transporter